MFGDSDDVLDIETTPEMREASELLTKAGESVASDSLPLKRFEALCSIKCFERIRDPWSMNAVEKASVLSCIEKCEEPMESVSNIIEDERNKMLGATTNCMERCADNDDVCANRCISGTISSLRVGQMMERVRARIESYRYSSA